MKVFLTYYDPKRDELAQMEAEAEWAAKATREWWAYEVTDARDSSLPLRTPDVGRWSIAFGLMGVEC